MSEKTDSKSTTGGKVVTVKEFYDNFHTIRREIGKVVIGQERAITHLLATMYEESL